MLRRILCAAAVAAIVCASGCTGHAPTIPPGPSGDNYVQTWGGPSADRTTGEVVDGNGNVYVAGVTYVPEEGNGMIVDLDPGPGIDPHTMSAGYNTFLTKFDRSGGFMWSHTWGGESAFIYEYLSLACDPDGNVYLCGRCGKGIDVDPGLDEHLTQLENESFTIIKLDAVGNFQWYVQIDAHAGEVNEYFSRVDCDGAGNLYIASTFSGVVDFDPGEAEDIRSSPSEVIQEYYEGPGASPGVWVETTRYSPTQFLLKIDSRGKYCWALTWQDDWSGAREISVDETGNAYLCGTAYGEIDFDPGPSVDYRNLGRRYSPFLMKIGSEGEYIFTRTWDADSSTGVDGVSVTGGGLVCVVGSFYEEVFFLPDSILSEDSPYYRKSEGSYDFYLSAFNPDGTLAWFQTWGSPDYEGAVAVDSDAEGNIWLTGMFRDCLDFDPGEGEEIRCPQDTGSSCYFILKLAGNGSYEWVRYSESLLAVSNYYYSLFAVGSNGNAWLAGGYTGAFAFDDGVPAVPDDMYGGSDCFLAWFPSDGTY
jgi:hypothetical protein